MKGRTYVCFVMFLAAVTLTLAGCAQKRGPAELESAQVEKSREAQGEAQERQPEKEIGGGEQKAKEGKVEEYGISKEKAERAKEPKEKGISQKAKQTLKRRIHFAFDSSRLSSKAQDLLKAKANILENHPDIRMVIAGHCDERGTDEYNMALGERRARAAYEYLILLGVGADRMDLVSYGEERPLVEGHNEEAWAKNRRDEFNISK